MKRLTKEQKKIILISGIAFTAIVIFWIFIYGPQSRKLSAIRKELQYTESQIRNINYLIQGKELSEAVKDLAEQLNRKANLILVSEEDLIHNLSEEARELNIKVKNIKPSGKQSTHQVAGYNIEESFISMNLSCEFRELGEYLNILRDNFPMLTKIRKLSINGKGEGRANLDVSLHISAYLAKD